MSEMIFGCDWGIFGSSVVICSSVTYGFLFRSAEELCKVSEASETWNQLRHLRTLDQLTLFPKPPLELRLLIWELLVPEHTIHEVRRRAHLEYCAMMQYSLLQRGFPATMAKPLLLKVNREARSVALKWYTPFLARNSIVAEIGTALYPHDDIGTKNNYQCGHIVTEGMPEVGDHVYRGRYFDPPIPVRGVLIKFPKRSLVDLKYDTLYFNHDTYLQENEHSPKLKDINWHVTLEDSCQVKHLAIDCHIWFAAEPRHQWYPEDLESAKYLDERGKIRYHQIWMDRPAHINKLDLQFGYLFQDGVFSSLNSLTLVFYDSGVINYSRDPDLAAGPITFVEQDDLGPLFRRKGSRRPGPYESVTRAIGMPNLPNPAAVLAQIEVLKAETAAQLAELKKNKQDIQFPEIKLRFAHRNGIFKQQ